MKGLNKVTLMGNVGKDPEIRYVEENVPVCSLSLATSESYTSKAGERITQTEWHNVVFWRGLAEIVEKYVKKGDPLYVEGRIRTRSYPDKEYPTITRYATDIVASDVRLLGQRDPNGSAPASKPAPRVASDPIVNVVSGTAVPPTPIQNLTPEAQAADAFDDDDDLPF